MTLAAAAVGSFGGEAAAPEGRAKDGVAASADIEIFCDMENRGRIAANALVTAVAVTQETDSVNRNQKRTNDA